MECPVSLWTTVFLTLIRRSYLGLDPNWALQSSTTGAVGNAVKVRFLF
ncbi:unnamed protein product [Calypogeia fissa]